MVLLDLFRHYFLNLLQNHHRHMNSRSASDQMHQELRLNLNYRQDLRSLHNSVDYMLYKSHQNHHHRQMLSYHFRHR